MKRQPFHRDASILLVGGRGTGRSSLALILRSSLRLKHIEIDDAFWEQTGLTRAAFKEEHGAELCRKEELNILKDILNTHSKDAVLVYPAGMINDACLEVVKQFADDHPVIHIRRSASGVQQYLKQWDLARIRRSQDLTDFMFRKCSNYEFYNLDEFELSISSPSINDSTDTLCLNYPEQRPQSLRLKRMEESFKRLISDVLNPRTKPEFGPRTLPPPPPTALHSYLLVIKDTELNDENFSVQRLDCGADACQLEIDLSTTSPSAPVTNMLESISRAFAILTSFFSGPIVYHVQRSPPTSTPSVDFQYVELLRLGLRLGADYLTVDLNLSVEWIRKVFAPHEASKLIGNFHKDSKGGDGWGMYHKCRALGHCGLRITQPAKSVEENYAVIGFNAEVTRTHGPRPFLIAYHTGRLGRLSRCFNHVLTPVTSPERKAQSTERITKDPDPALTIRDCQQALYSSFVYDAMKYYVVGLDVSYSLSPEIHNAAHEFFGMPHRLTRKSVPSLDDVSELVNDIHFGGLSIAQGYKTSILTRLNAVSTHARNIGAVNTVIPIRRPYDYTKPPPFPFWAARNRAGPVVGLYGDNIDWIGLSRCVLQNLSPANVITEKTAALVIGAGGIARAAVYALMKIGVTHIVIQNRTVSHAKELADHFAKLDLTDQPQRREGGTGQEEQAKHDIRVIETMDAPWFSDIAQPTIVICCVPTTCIGGAPGPKIELPQEWMKSSTGGVVLDLNYRPLLTPLLRQIRQQSHRGWVWAHGLDNLTTQAAAQFQVFTGRKVPQNLMRPVALRTYLHSNGQDPEIRDFITSTGYWI